MWDIFFTALLWQEGKYILLVLLAIAVAGYWWYKPLLYLAIVLLVFTIFFFRNPIRICSAALKNNAVIVCPADGKVVDVQISRTGELEGYAQKVSIYLSPFDVHVNWIPYTGTVKDVIYKSGTFSLAFLPKSSALNERNDIIIQGDNAATIKVRQIAGTIARRICCWVKPVSRVNAGQKFGMIRFGSRVDIFLPANVRLEVGVGQRVYGGQTVLGVFI